MEDLLECRERTEDTVLKELGTGPMENWSLILNSGRHSLKFKISAYLLLAPIGRGLAPPWAASKLGVPSKENDHSKMCLYKSVMYEGGS